MADMLAPRPHFEHYTSGSRLYRADEESVLSQVGFKGEILPIDDKDIYDLFNVGCKIAILDGQGARLASLAEAEEVVPPAVVTAIRSVQNEFAPKAAPAPAPRLQRPAPAPASAPAAVAAAVATAEHSAPS
jgi:hypothetical protein